jgi:hypothetical protein
MNVPRGGRAERADYYRKMAEETEEFAAKTHFADMREEYLKLAKGWRELADETESTR